MSRCLSILVIAVAALTLASPFAAAQIAPFTLSSTPEARSVFPGESANFTITVGNDHAVLARTASLNVTSTLPVDWTSSFAPPSVVVNASSHANVTLSVYVPADAAPQTLNITYEAYDSIGGSSRRNVTVTVKEQPLPSSGAANAPPAPPRLILSVSVGDSAPSGTTAEGIVTIRHDDPTRSSMNVQLSANGPWNARLDAADQNRVLDSESVKSASVRVFVDVPELSANASVMVTITARVGDSIFTVPWTVTGIASPDASADASAGGTGAADPGSGSATPSGPFPRSNFEILVTPLELPIEPNGDAVANVRLTNTGTTSLTVVLTAPPPSQWRPFDLVDSVTLAPGETRNVAMTLHAPPGIPSGGSAQINVQGAADGVVRRSLLILHMVPPSVPVDETPAAVQAEAPVAPEGSGLPTLGPAALVAVGLAAAGSAALIVVNRPLREKLIWGAVGMYTRLARPDVLGHEDREKLYRLVETQPGIHFHALQRDLAWNTGTLTYHVRVLEKHGFVVSRRDGLFRRFYLAGAAPRKEVFENQGPTGLRADVIEALTNTPGISQSDLALALGANKQTVNYHVKALERAGTIKVEKRGRDTFLYPATDTPAAPERARV